MSKHILPQQSKRFHGTLNRRQFLRRVSTLALGGSALLLQGCQTDFADDEEDQEMLYDVVIAGGGISGLTTAYLLRDKKIILLEKIDTPGGRISSGQWGGFHYPRGMEYIGKPEGKLAEWFDELGLTPMAIPPPTGAVAYQGKIHSGEHILDFLPSPKALEDYIRLAESLEDLNGQGIEAALFEGLEDLYDFAELDETSVAEWMDDNSFDPLIQHLVNIENRGLFGSSNEDLSFLFNIPEMAYNLYDPTESDTSEVYTFRRGMIEVVEALEQQLSGQIRSGAEVTQVRVNNDETASVTYQWQGQKTTAQAQAVVLATPAAITAKLVANGFSEDVFEALQAIPYAPYITLNLGCKSQKMVNFII